MSLTFMERRLRSPDEQVGIHFGLQGSFKSILRRFHRRDLFHRYALYSGLSPGFQTYLEGLKAVHSGVAQAEGARAAGLPVRRQEIETVHPLVRVHPATGWKSVFVNPGMFAKSIFARFDTDLLLQGLHAALLGYQKLNRMLF